LTDGVVGCAASVKDCETAGKDGDKLMLGFCNRQVSKLTVAICRDLMKRSSDCVDDLCWVKGGSASIYACIVYL